MKDHEILGVDRGATRAALKDRWRDVAFLLHPDRGGDPVEFGRVRKAYGRLLAKAFACNACKDSGTREIVAGFNTIKTVCKCRGGMG